jgi:hypothetical protein
MLVVLWDSPAAFASCASVSSVWAQSSEESRNLVLYKRNVTTVHHARCPQIRLTVMGDAPVCVTSSYLSTSCDQT